MKSSAEGSLKECMQPAEIKLTAHQWLEEGINLCCDPLIVASREKDGNIN
jgi:hypothetical protein